VTLETVDGLGAALALGALAGEIGLRFGVAAGALDRDAVDGRVDLAVAAAVEAVAVGVARADRDRRLAAAVRGAFGLRAAAPGSECQEGGREEERGRG
jgi:hypothetical protein